MFAFHRSLKIRIIRPQIELLSLEVLSAIFTLLNVHTFDVYGHMIKIEALWRVTREAAFTTLFLAKKGTKGHSKYLVPVSMC